MGKTPQSRKTIMDDIYHQHIGSNFCIYCDCSYCMRAIRHHDRLFVCALYDLVNFIQTLIVMAQYYQ